MTSRSERERTFAQANVRYIFFILVILLVFGYLLFGLMDLQLSA